MGHVLRRHCGLQQYTMRVARCARLSPVTVAPSSPHALANARHSTMPTSPSTNMAGSHTTRFIERSSHHHCAALASRRRVRYGSGGRGSVLACPDLDDVLADRPACGPARSPSSSSSKAHRAGSGRLRDARTGCHAARDQSHHAVAQAEALPSRGRRACQSIVTFLADEDGVATGSLPHITVPELPAPSRCIRAAVRDRPGCTGAGGVPSKSVEGAPPR